MAVHPHSDTQRDLIVIASLALAPAIGLGIARFAYALVLPDMRADLGWTYADAGWMNTTNAAGYLLGALLTARSIERFGAFRVLAAGVWACVIALLLCAFFRHPLPLNAARLLAGIGGGLAFVSGGVLAVGVAQRNPDRSAFMLGLFYAGPGLGILLSGIAVPTILEKSGPGSWTVAWAALAILSLLMASGLFIARHENTTRSSLAREKPSYKPMLWLLPAYAFFGAGYITYMTFMIAWVQNSGGSAGFQALFWCTIGLAAIASPWLYAGILKRLWRGSAFAVLTGITAIGATLPLLSEGVPLLLTSATVFGSAFFSVVASTTAFVRRNYSQAQWPAAIGTLTVVFGVGQMLGPVVTGFINDLMKNLAGGLWTSVLLLFVAMLIAALQRDQSIGP